MQKFRVINQVQFVDKTYNINTRFSAATEEELASANNTNHSLAYKLALRQYTYGRFSDGKLRWVHNNHLVKINCES